MTPRQPAPTVYLTTTEGDALESFRMAVACAREGRGQLLVWPGAAGCGKTFLLDRAERVAIDDCGIARHAVFRDFFKPVVQRPHGFGKWSDVAESLVKDIHERFESGLWFKNTIVKVLRLAVDQFGPDLLQPVRARALGGELPRLLDLLRAIATQTQTPAILLLDDVDYADSSGIWMPEILHEIHGLARVSDARFVVVVTMGMRKGLWTALHDEAAWGRDWVVSKALLPFDVSEVDDLLHAVCAPDGLPASVVGELARATGGVPLLVMQELDTMRQVGDLTLWEGCWTYEPGEIDFTDFDRFDRGARQTNTTQAFIRNWYTRMAEDRKWPAIADDVLAAAALEGVVFTLEAVHAFLRRSAPETLPAEWADFDAFATWVDGTLVGESTDGERDGVDAAAAVNMTDTVDALSAFTLPLSDETYGVSASGTSRYAFSLPVVREYFFGQAAGRRLDREAVRTRFSVYADCLAKYALESPAIACRVAELYEAAGHETEAEQWGERAIGHDLEQLDRAIESLGSLPQTPAVALQIARLSVATIEVSRQIESLERILARCETALRAATRAENRELKLEASYRRAFCLRDLGQYLEALAIADAVWAAERDERFLDLRASIYGLLGRYMEGAEDYRTILAITEDKLGSDLVLTQTPDRASFENLDSSRRVELDNWAKTVISLAKFTAGPNGDLDVTSARSMTEHAIAVRTALFGPDHEELWQARFDLTWILEKCGDVEGARATLTDLVHERIRKTETRRHNTLLPRLRLAAHLNHQGDHDGARREYQGALEIAEQLFGSESPDVLEMRLALAFGLLRQRNNKACLEQLSRLAEEAQRAPDRDGFRILRVRRMMAEAYWLAGASSTASRLSADVLEAYSRLLGPEHEDVENIRREIVRYATTATADDLLRF